MVGNPARDDVSGMTPEEAAASITADLTNILSTPPPGGGISAKHWTAHVVHSGIEVMLKQNGLDNTVAELRRYADELEARARVLN